MTILSSLPDARNCLLGEKRTQSTTPLYQHNPRVPNLCVCSTCTITLAHPHSLREQDRRWLSSTISGFCRLHSAHQFVLYGEGALYLCLPLLVGTHRGECGPSRLAHFPFRLAQVSFRSDSGAKQLPLCTSQDGLTKCIDKQVDRDVETRRAKAAVEFRTSNSLEVKPQTGEITLEARRLAAARQGKQAQKKCLYLVIKNISWSRLYSSTC
jgi:hypothetical protein